MFEIKLTDERLRLISILNSRGYIDFIYKGGRFARYEDASGKMRKKSIKEVTKLSNLERCVTSKRQENGTVIIRLELDA